MLWDNQYLMKDLCWSKSIHYNFDTEITTAKRSNIIWYIKCTILTQQDLSEDKQNQSINLCSYLSQNSQLIPCHARQIYQTWTPYEQNTQKIIICIHTKVYNQCSTNIYQLWLK